MIRLLFLTESFWPVVGGGEIHIRALATRLVRDGVKCTVVTRRGQVSWPAEEELGGVRILRVAPSGLGRPGKYLMVPFATRALTRERHRFDVVVVRGTRILGPLGLAVGRALRKGVVLQAEVNGELSGEIYTWGTELAGTFADSWVRRAVRLRNRLLRRADAFVAMSALIREEFIACGVPPERVVHIPHGVDTVRFRPASESERAMLRDQLGLPQEALVVVNTGRLLRGKGLEVLFEAFQSLAEAEPTAMLVIVGSGEGQALSVEEDLRARAARLGGRIRFTGAVSNVEDYLRSGDVFAFPSLFEGLGISLIEAAACGLACVASRTGGIVDVIDDDRHGLLVEPGDSRQLATALRALASDRARRLALGLAARQRASVTFDLESSVARYRQLFEAVRVQAAGGPGASATWPGAGASA